MKRHHATPALLGGLVGLAAALALLGALLWRAPAGVAQEQQPLVEYPDYAPTPTVGPNPTAPAEPASAPLYSQGFESGAALAELELVDLDPVLADQRANWRVAGGRLRQANAGGANNPSTHEAAALVAEGSYGDVVVRASFYDEYNGVAGLVARYTGETGAEASYYRYTILKSEYEAEPKQQIEKVVDGVATTIAESAGGGFSPRAWHVIELRVVGGQISVTVDGQPALSATDPQPLPAGTAGVYTRAFGGIFYDDLLVSQP